MVRLVHTFEMVQPVPEGVPLAAERTILVPRGLVPRRKSSHHDPLRRIRLTQRHGDPTSFEVLESRLQLRDGPLPAVGMTHP